MIALVFLFLTMLMLKHPSLLPFADPDQSTSLALGFILIFPFLFGKLGRWPRSASNHRIPPCRNPLWPHVLKFLEIQNEFADLQLIDGLALVDCPDRRDADQPLKSASQVYLRA